MEAGDCSTSGSNSAVNGSMTNEEEISHSLPTPDSADGKKYIYKMHCLY